jgi:aldehyde dehydrogenase (NAD+)
MAPTEAPVPRALTATGHRGVVYRDPYGVALIIGPFNGPLLPLLRPAIAALAAGNCCVLKLSNAVKSSSALLLDLVPKYFEPDAVAAVSGHREETTELLKLPFDFIFFTGSTSTGKVVARAAAENLTPVLLELGGQNPALVDETANIPDAARKIVWGAMAWGGQWCTSPGYAYVHESVAEAFVGFGGVGSAGMGHYYGKSGFDMLTHAKSMLISPPDVAIDHLFPPYTAEKNAALKMWFEY